MTANIIADMPRRKKRDPNYEEGRNESLARLASSMLGPPAARLAGYVVRTSTSQKSYRCPFCQGIIGPGVQHVVAYPEGSLDDRRHYHSACWSRHKKGIK